MKKTLIGFLTFVIGAYAALSIVNVFAFTEPSQNPPDGNVTPNFSGISIDDGRFTLDHNNGVTTIGGNSQFIFDRQSQFNNGLGLTDGILYVNDDGIGHADRRDILLRDPLDARGSIANKGAGNGGAVYINDDLTMASGKALNLSDFGIYTEDPDQPILLRKPTEVEGSLSVTGGIKNNSGDVVITDRLSVQQPADFSGGSNIVRGELDLRGQIRNLAPGANNTVTFDSDVAILGDIKSPGDVTTFNDNAAFRNDLTINGDVFLTGNEVNHTGDGVLTLRDINGIDLDVTRNADKRYVTVLGNNDADGAFIDSGIFRVKNGNTALLFDNNEMMSSGGPLYINNDNNQAVQIGSAGHRANVTVHGSLNATIGIGRYYSTTGDAAARANSTASTSSTCSEGDFRVACSGGFTGAIGANGSNLIFHDASPSPNNSRSCRASMFNGTNIADRYRVVSYAYCFSPDG